jgi:hypothetical protein
MPYVLKGLMEKQSERTATSDLTVEIWETLPDKAGSRGRCIHSTFPDQPVVQRFTLGKIIVASVHVRLTSFMNGDPGRYHQN